MRNIFCLAMVIMIGWCSGCTVQKTLQITDGNKKDGTLEMKYNYGALEDPEVQWEQSKQKALEKCKSWGYSEVEFFESKTKQCVSYDSDGNCSKWVVTHNAQCLN